MANTNLRRLLENMADTLSRGCPTAEAAARRLYGDDWREAYCDSLSVLIEQALSAGRCGVETNRK